MFEDVIANKISAKTVDKPIGRGSFGAVYRVKIPSVSLLQTVLLLNRLTCVILCKEEANRINFCYSYYIKSSIKHGQASTQGGLVGADKLPSLNKVHNVLVHHTHQKD